MSQMMDPTQMGPPPGAPDPSMGGGPPDPSGGGGLPPALMAALSGGGGGGSQDLTAQGPMAGEEASASDAPADDTSSDPLSMVREAIDILRQAGTVDTNDVRSHMIDKVQADLQKILATESQKTDKLKSALGG